MEIAKIFDCDAKSCVYNKNSIYESKAKGGG